MSERGCNPAKRRFLDEARFLFEEAHRQLGLPNHYATADHRLAHTRGARLRA